MDLRSEIKKIIILAQKVMCKQADKRQLSQHNEGIKKKIFSIRTWYAYNSFLQIKRLLQELNIRRKVLH